MMIPSAGGIPSAASASDSDNGSGSVAGEAKCPASCTFSNPFAVLTESAVTSQVQDLQQLLLLLLCMCS